MADLISTSDDSTSGGTSTTNLQLRLPSHRQDPRSEKWQLHPKWDISDLHYELPRADALLLLSSIQLEHVYPAKHGVDSALERLESLSCDLWTWRELQSSVCERRSKPLLPDVDAFFGLADTGTPVCDGMSVCTSENRG
jgi:hypothetical protein